MCEGDRERVSEREMVGEGGWLCVNIDFYLSDALAGSKDVCWWKAMPEKATGGDGATEIASGADEEKLSAITRKGLHTITVLKPTVPVSKSDWTDLSVLLKTAV